MRFVRKSGRCRVIKTRANSLLVGEMPRGCELCIGGAKLVLFLTGVCAQDCYYCPISEKRRGLDVTHANERPVRSAKDIVREAKLMDALGTGITGGDPSLRLRRTLRYIKMLKREFGKRHHIHMYCGGELSREQLYKLKQAGLDEI
ncbi:MAG TPA: radical SAM protein, partial [Hadesarchaea archaeon]|nr:radical SAM protein [Hadesarchaea archaeon]